VVEQVLAAVIKDTDRLDDLLDELARARLWLPLPAGRRPVIDGSAVTLPTVTYLGAEFVPAFTSVQRLGSWAEPESAGEPPGETTHDGVLLNTGLTWHRAGDPRVTPHIVVPAAPLARLLPAELGIALNPGAEASVPIYPAGVAHLAAAAQDPRGGTPIRVGHPPAEPVALLREVRCRLRALVSVRQVSRAWLSVHGQGEGLIISVTLDDPASEPARAAVLSTIERAAAAVPRQASFPIDVTFPGESEPDLLDDWVAGNASPFYTRD
jgi:hypothetical protein